MDGLVNGLVAALASLGHCGDGLSGPAADFAWHMGLIVGAGGCFLGALMGILFAEVMAFLFREKRKP